MESAEPYLQILTVQSTYGENDANPENTMATTIVKCELQPITEENDDALREQLEPFRDEGIELNPVKCEGPDSDNEVLSKYVQNFSYQCSHCQKSFTDLSSFRHHETLHSDGAFICHFCSDRFHGLSGIRRHILEHHLDIKPYVCKTCQTAFSRENLLLKHRKTVHGVKWVSCRTCKKKFKSIFMLNCHKKNHLRKKSEKCSHCTKTFLNRNKLLHHCLIDHSDIEECTSFAKSQGYSLPDNTCLQCGKIFPNQENLALHEKTHTVFNCNFCHTSFNAKNSIKLHIFDQHLGLKPHKCKLCKKSFALKSGLLIHTRKHTGIGLIECKLCSKTFSYKAKLKIHMRCHSEVKPHKCNDCNSIFQSLRSLEKHCAQAHPETANFVCEICSLSFVFKPSLELHMVKHVGDPQACSICEKTFASKTLLASHMRSIHYIRYICPICGKQCKDKYSHLKIHSDYRPFPCEHCEKKFRSKHHLTLHLRIHTGDKPYQCEICSKHFSFKSNLNAHQRIHSGEKSYICAKCGKAFPYQSGLRRHIVDKVCSDKIRNIQLPTLLRPKILSNNENPDPSKTIYECERCQKEFYHKSSFNRHNKLCPLRYDINAQQGGININKFKCEACGRCYKNRSSLSMHKRMHAKKFITCGICSKPFIRKSHYKEHMLSKHSVVKPFRCGYCGISFHLKHILQRHIRKAHGGPNADINNFDQFIDNQNNFAYDLTTEIISTYLDADSGKSHKCKDCGRCYKSKSSYEKHITIHTTKALCCNECGKAFSQKRYLDDHLVRMHPNVSSERNQVERNQVVTVLVPEPQITPVEPQVETPQRVIEVDLRAPIIEIDPMDAQMMKRFKCLYCDMSFVKKEDLDVHSESHWSISHPSHSGAVYATNTTIHVNNMQDLIPSYIQTYQPTFQTVKTVAPTYTISSRDYWEDPNEVQYTSNAINVAYEAIALDTDGDHLSLDDGPNDVIYVIDANQAVEPLPAPVEPKKEKPFTCEQCSKTYSSEKSLKSHMLAHAGKAVDCVFCQKSFAPKLLKSHVKNVHMTVKMLKCPICAQYFMKKKMLDEHLKIHMDEFGNIVDNEDEGPQPLLTTPQGIISTEGIIENPGAFVVPKKKRKVKKPVVDKPYKCYECGKSYFTRTSLSTHRRVHTGKALCCVFCQKQFIKKHQLKDHVTAVHMKVKNYQCNICEKLFPRRISLEKHLRSHQPKPEIPPGGNPAKPFKCNECPKCFGSRNYLQEHMKLHTGKGIPCEICGKVFTKEKAVKEHIMAIHTLVRPYQCEFCDRSFTQKSNYNLHRRKHTGEKLRECSFCGKKFTSQAPLRRHLRSHTGHKPFPCPHCEKTFADPSNLKKHVLVHTGTKKYECDVCKSGFNTKTAFKNHVVIHDPDYKPKPGIVHECDECKETFSCKSRLLVHKRAHKYNKYQFLCAVCGRSFASKGRLLVHMSAHNGVLPYNCAFCEKGFELKIQMSLHVKSHLKSM